jgi:hypothetical protein
VGGGKVLMPLIRRNYGTIHKLIGRYYIGARLGMGRNGLFKGEKPEMREMPEGHYPRMQPRKHPYANTHLDIYLGPIEFHSHRNNENGYGAYWRIGPIIFGSHPSNIRLWRYWRRGDHSIGLSFKWHFQINKYGDE